MRRFQRYTIAAVVKTSRDLVRYIEISSLENICGGDCDVNPKPIYVFTDLRAQASCQINTIHSPPSSIVGLRLVCVRVQGVVELGGDIDVCVYDWRALTSTGASLTRSLKDTGTPPSALASNLFQNHPLESHCGPWGDGVYCVGTSSVVLAQAGANISPILWSTKHTQKQSLSDASAQQSQIGLPEQQSPGDISCRSSCGSEDCVCGYGACSLWLGEARV